MKIKIKEIILHSFKNFPELTYKVSSGEIYGRNGEGKTNLLNAIISAFTNTDLYGSKQVPLQYNAAAGWVKLMCTFDDEETEIYRTWQRTDTGFSSSSSLCKTLQKNLFLSIANPLYIFSLDTSDKIDLIIDTKYYNFKGDILSEISGDIPIEVLEYIKGIGSITFAKIKNLLKTYKLDLKTYIQEKNSIEAQKELLPRIENGLELAIELDSREDEVNQAIDQLQSNIMAIEKLRSVLMKNAIEDLNKSLVLTRIKEDGKIIFNDVGIEHASSSEMLDCGLDIANTIAGNYDIIPPTFIDNVCSREILDHNLFPNLSQFITTSFADVNLCEHNGGYLHAMDKSWKIKATAEIKPNIQIEMIPYI